MLWLWGSGENRLINKSKKLKQYINPGDILLTQCFRPFPFVQRAKLEEDKFKPAIDLMGQELWSNLYIQRSAVLSKSCWVFWASRRLPETSCEVWFPSFLSHTSNLKPECTVLSYLEWFFHLSLIQTLFLTHPRQPNSGSFRVHRDQSNDKNLMRGLSS